ncbi:Zn-dependent exopeptidase, partial [Neoconidiobolus thromboides FSU 785]
MKVLNLVLLSLGQTITSQKIFENKPEHHQLAIKNFIDFLKFDTSHPNPNYNGTVKYLENIANQLNLKFTQFKCQPSGTPSVVLTWPGTDKNLPSVVLNSHYDVVPVIKDHWTYEPFNATITKDKEGYDSIYARGSQDVKSLGIMYIEAIRKLKSEMKAGPLRT